ncbi:MAG: COG1361 S-layer family protein [Haloferacaceae archaeon]
MKYEPYVTGAFVALLALSTVPAGVVAVSHAYSTVVGHPDLHASVRDNEFTAGSEATLDLYVQNDGVLTQGGPAEYETRVETARSTSLSISGGDGPLKVHTKQYPAGDVGPGVNGPYAIGITVPEGTDPGTYYLDVHAHYTYTSTVHYDPGQPEYSDFQDDVSFRVPVVVRSRAEFAVVDSSTSVHVDQRGTYDLTIENTGTEVARNAVVRIDSRTDAVTFGTSGRTASTSVRTWRPGETKTLTYDAAIGDTAGVHNYSVPVNVTFDDADGVTRHGNRLVATFRPAPKQSFSLGDVHSTLRIGRSDGTLRGTVTNDGPETVHDVTLVIENNVSHVTFDQRSYSLPALAPGETAPFSFSVGRVADDANVSSVPVEFAVRYDDQEGDRYASDGHQATVGIGGNHALFDVEAVNEIPAGTRGDTPKDSDWSTLTLRVTNRGDTTLHDVRPSLVFDTQYFERPIESNYRTSVIRTLRPGESKNVTYAVSASGAAGGTTYPLDVAVAYERPNGVTQRTTPYTVPVSIAEKSSLPLLPIGGGAVVLIGCLIGGLIWWRRSPTEE